jgi:uncharacterized protein YjbJ (UPF0337 family)
MNTLMLKGSWDHLKGSLKEKYAKLTNDDLKYVEGKEEELYGRIQKRLGVTKEHVEQIIKEHYEKIKGREKTKKAIK